jgi:hypothetical protein
MANPPICIGALYCLRDVLSGATLSWIRGWKQRRQEEDIAATALHDIYLTKSDTVSIRESAP